MMALRSGGEPFIEAVRGWLRGASRFSLSNCWIGSVPRKNTGMESTSKQTLYLAGR